MFGFNKCNVGRRDDLCRVVLVDRVLMADEDIGRGRHDKMEEACFPLPKALRPSIIGPFFLNFSNLL